MDFPHDQYGYPIADGYEANVDLALQSVAMSTYWTRQRRTYTHSASTVKVSFRLTLKQSKSLIDWLQSNDDWFNMDLISGDDSEQPEQIYPVNVKRSSSIQSTRVPLADLTLVSFEVETHSMPHYVQLTNAVAGKPAYTYPANLPLPKADGFTSSHAERNITSYTLNYEMNTNTLKKWQEFAAFAGTAYFKHFLVSSNSYGTNEVIRYIDNPTLTLVTPDWWSVSINAEGYPTRGVLATYDAGDLSPDSYNYPIIYDDTVQMYDGSGGGTIPPPPQGGFTMPASTVVVSATFSSINPATRTVRIRFKQDGTITTSDPESPVWDTWHTDASTLNNQAIIINASVEVSTDGTNYSTNIPGTSYSLQGQDVYIRLSYYATSSSTKSISVPVKFSDGASVPTIASATVQLSVTAEIQGTGSIVNGFVWEDVLGESTGGLLTVGVQVQPDGSCFAGSDGLITDDWYSPITPAIGNKYTLRITKTSGNLDINNQGRWLSMRTPLTYSATVRAETTTPVVGTYEGVCTIVGGPNSTPVSGTIRLTGTVTKEF